MRHGIFITSGNLTAETLAFSGSSLSLPTQDWNSGRRESASSAGTMRYTNSKAFLHHTVDVVNKKLFNVLTLLRILALSDLATMLG